MGVYSVTYPNGNTKWVCLSCGGSRVTRVTDIVKTNTASPLAALDWSSCHYCHLPFDPEDKHLRPTRDHIVPRALGGKNALWNYVPAHQKCNGRKKDDWPTCTCKKCTTAIEIYRRSNL